MVAAPPAAPVAELTTDRREDWTPPREEVMLAIALDAAEEACELVSA